MAYLQTIVRAQWSFSGEGWVTYDTCYRHQAWNHLTGGNNETFAGRAKGITRCKYCSSEHHTSTECTFAPDVSRQPKPAPRYNRYWPNRWAGEFCHLYNNKSRSVCKYYKSKFTHRCEECQGFHPVSQCRSRPPPSKSGSLRGDPRTGSPGRSKRKWTEEVH